MSLAARLMRNPVLAAVYERAWRPALGFGLLGFDLRHVLGEQTAAVEALRLRPGARVLDVACGPGSLARRLAAAVGPDGVAVGLDASAPMLAQAVRRREERPWAPGPAYVRASAHALPFEDASFDGVSCYAALYLVPDPFGAMAEMARVLAPGGRLALMASIESPHAPVRVAQHAVLPFSGLRMFHRHELTGWLLDHGFTEVERQRQGVAQYVHATAPR